MLIYLKRIILILSVLFFIGATSIYLNAKPAYAAVNLESEVILFTADEWGELQNKSPDVMAEKLLLQLNARRDLIGKSALKIVHPNNNAVYQRTDSVFIAPRDGGGYVYGFIVHWFRDVLLGVGKNLTTKIAWEILDNQHFQAKVVEDSSIFSPVNSEELEKLFKELIPKKA